VFACSDAINVPIAPESPAGHQMRQAESAGRMTPDPGLFGRNLPSREKLSDQYQSDKRHF
jgi:hypothetical protein